jgi:hypothetical protein
VNQANPIDLSFIPTALRAVNQRLHEADVAEGRNDAETTLDKLLEAGGEARAALKQLNGSGLWDALRLERERRQQQWQDLVLPATDKLLKALRYTPLPTLPPASAYIDPGNKAMRQAAGIPEPDAPDPITQAKAAVTTLDQLLQELISDLNEERKKAENPPKIELLKNGIRGLCREGIRQLTAAFVAATVLPAAQAVIEQVSPEARDLLHHLLVQTRDTLPWLSTVFVAGIAIPDDAVRQLIEARDLPELEPQAGLQAPMPGHPPSRSDEAIPMQPSHVVAIERAPAGVPPTDPLSSQPPREGQSPR